MKKKTTKKARPKKFSLQDFIDKLKLPIGGLVFDEAHDYAASRPNPPAPARRRRKKPFVDRVVETYLAKPKPDPIPPESTAFPSDWVPSLTPSNSMVGQARAAVVPSGEAASEWFLSREKNSQRCNKLLAWAKDVGTELARVASNRYEGLAPYAAIVMCWAKNDDAIFMVLPPKEQSYLDAYVVVVPASAVPAQCDGCQTNMAKQKINVRPPQKHVFGFGSSKNQPTN